MGPVNRTDPGTAGADADEAAATDAQVADNADLRVSTPEYRRVGQAMATVTVTIGSSGPLTIPPAHVRMCVRSAAAYVALDPVLVTHEAPGAQREQHRLWFLADLSQLISDDTSFALVAGSSEIPLRDPQPRAPWDAEDEATAAMDSAWSESELRAVVGALEERCRVAERAAADLRGILEGDTEIGEYTSKLTNAWREVEVLQELLDTRESAYRAVKEVLDAAAAERDARDAQISVIQDELERARREARKRDDALTTEVERARERAADGRRMAEVVAATLTQVQTERQALLDQAAQAVADLDRERSERETRLAEAQQAIDALTLELRTGAPRPRRSKGLMAKLQAAAGVGRPAHDPIVEQQRATIADLERRVHTAESRAVEAAQEQARTESELHAQLEEQRAELALVHAALDEMHARFDASPAPTPAGSDEGLPSSPPAGAGLIARLDAAQGAAHSAEQS